MSMGSNAPLMIAAVIDAATNRDLLADPRPLSIAADAPAPLQVVNGPAGPLRITLAADQPWLRASPAELNLAAGGAGTVMVAAAAEGNDEFALLELRWQAAGETLAESILVQRQRRPAITPTPTPTPTAPPVKAPTPTAPADTSALPDWMR